MSSKYEQFLFLCFHFPMDCYESPSRVNHAPKLPFWHIISFQQRRFLWSDLAKPHIFSHRCCCFSLQGWFCSKASRCWAYWPKNMYNTCHLRKYDRLCPLPWNEGYLWRYHSPDLQYHWSICTPKHALRAWNSHTYICSEPFTRRRKR